jgi:hypothetical protein
MSNNQKDKDVKVLDWLSPLNYGHTQTDTLRRRAPGTCQWLLDSNEYKAWFQAANQKKNYSSQKSLVLEKQS